MRRAYREGLRAAEHGIGIEPPAPLDPTQAEAFVEWIRQEQALESLSPRVRAAVLIQEGPYLGSRNGLVRFAQRLLLRVLRPLLIHDQSVARAILQSVDEVSEQQNGNRRLDRRP